MQRRYNLTPLYPRYFPTFFLFYLAVHITSENLTDCREELFLVLTTCTGESQGPPLGFPFLPFLTPVIT